MQIEAEKDRKEARNRAYLLLKKNKGYFNMQRAAESVWRVRTTSTRA
jgi:hypothetical protein